MSEPNYLIMLLFYFITQSAVHEMVDTKQS